MGHFNSIAIDILQSYPALSIWGPRLQKCQYKEGSGVRDKQPQSAASLSSNSVLEAIS